MTTLNNTTKTTAEELQECADYILEDYENCVDDIDLDAESVIDIIKFYRKILEKTREENEELKSVLISHLDERLQGYIEGVASVTRKSVDFGFTRMKKYQKENEEFKKKEYDNNVKIASWLIALDMSKNQDYQHEGNDAITVKQLWKCVKDFGVDENNPNVKREHYRNWSEFPENGIDN